MNTKALQSSWNKGITFAVIIVFLALIGFTVTGAGLIAKALGNAPKANQMPQIGYFVALLALLGLWNGAYASGSTAVRGRLNTVLSASLVAGVVVGIFSALLALIYGGLLTRGVDPRNYLSMVSPESMRLYLFNNNATTAALLHVLVAAASAVAGGVLAYLLRSAGAGRRLRGGYERLRSAAWIHSLRRIPYFTYILYALVALLMFLLPRQWGSYWNYIIGTVGIYVILGLGLNIIVGLAGQLVLGYVAFFAIGAYTVALLTAPQPHALEWNFWIVLLVGILLAALTGLLLGLPILRLRGDYLAIVTLGFGEIIRIMLRSDLLTDFTAGPKGVRDIAGPTLFGYPISNDINFLYVILLAMLVAIFFTRRLQNSRTGRAWVAIREDEVAARATGINTFQSKLLALAIGAAFAGLGGVLFASRNQFTGPEDHGLMVSINVLALVIVGGMGSIPGIILGAFALKGLPEMLRELENYRLMFFGGLLVLMMILRPEGLWPASRPRLEDTLTSKKPSPGTVETSVETEGAKHATNA